MFSSLRSIFFSSSLVWFVSANAEVAIFGGSGSVGTSSDAPLYPIADVLSNENPSVTPLLSLDFQGFIHQVAIDSYRGTVIYVGGDGDDHPLLLQGSVASQNLQRISIPTDLGNGILSCVAIDSEGTAILGGTGVATPLIFRLSLGETQPTQISLPSADEGFINQVAITPDNIAILVGRNHTSGTPLIYALTPGANEAIAVSFPNPSTPGTLRAVAITSNGTAILGGQDETDNGQALIYRLLPGSLSASAISIPNPNDGSQIASIAVRPDDTAILVGDRGTASVSPLIYTVGPESTTASIIPNPSPNDGSLLSVAVGSDGTAILGGTDDTTQLPLIYRLTPDASEPSLVTLPNANQGQIFSIAIGSENIALLGGSYIDTNHLLLLSLPLSSSTASIIEAPISLNDESIMSIAIYNSNGLYDIRRLRPYYYLNLSDANNKLKESGLP